MQQLRSSLPETVLILQSIFSSKDWVSCVRLNCSSAPSTGLHCPQDPVNRNCTRKNWMKGKEVMMALDIKRKDLQGWISSKRCLVCCFQQDPLESCVTSTLDATGDRWCRLGVLGICLARWLTVGDWSSLWNVYSGNCLKWHLTLKCKNMFMSGHW